MLLSDIEKRVEKEKDYSGTISTGGLFMERAKRETGFSIRAGFEDDFEIDE